MRRRSFYKYSIQFLNCLKLNEAESGDEVEDEVVDGEDADDDDLSRETDERDDLTSIFEKPKYKRGMMYTEAQAIKHLKSGLAKPSKDKKFESKNSFFDRTVARCIVDFFQVKKDYHMGKVQASICVAYHQFQKSNTNDSYRAQCIRQWAQSFLVTGDLPKFKQGQHVKTHTIITDESVQSLLRDELRAMEDFDRTPLNFMKALNTRILATVPNAPEKISEETARRWMITLGFSLVKMSKSYYTDEHNRKDNVEYRDLTFLPRMNEYERRMSKWEIDGKGNPVKIPPDLKPGEKEVVLITHDESTFYSNECKQVVWMENGYAFNLFLLWQGCNY